jgi:hypothetical protein
VSIEMAILKLVESGIGSAKDPFNLGVQVDSWLIQLAEHGRFVFGCHRNMK